MEKRAWRTEYHAVGTLSGVISHFRVRPSKTATTVRVEDDQIEKIDGPIADARASLHALYVVDRDDRDSVLELAARIPTARTGGAVEVWTLMER